MTTKFVPRTCFAFIFHRSLFFLSGSDTMTEEFDFDLKWDDLWVTVGWVQLCSFVFVALPFSVWQYKQMNFFFGTDIMDFRHPVFYYPVFVFMCLLFNGTVFFNSITLITKNKIILSRFVVLSLLCFFFPVFFFLHKIGYYITQFRNIKQHFRVCI